MPKLFEITIFRCLDSERMMDCIGEGEFTNDRQAEV